jgi:hypothetical protein
MLVRFPAGGSGFGFSQVFLDLVKMGEASNQFGSGVGFGVCFVGSVAVALDVSAICFTEGFGELFRSATVAPVVEEAAAGRVGDDLFGSFDAVKTAVSAPTTRSLILFCGEVFSVPLIPRPHLRAAQVDAVQ